jgi:hypothetical protein
MKYQVKTNLQSSLLFFFVCSSIVVRSSTNKLQDVYAKAKETSVLIRFPCNLAETVADKSLKFVLAVVNPLVKPLSGPGKTKFQFDKSTFFSFLII